MNKREGKKVIIASFIVVLILVFTVINTITTVRNRMADYCFKELNQTSEELAQKLYDSMNNDRTMLMGIGQIIAAKDNPTKEEMIEIMNSYDLMNSYISYIVILLPNNEILRQDGKTMDVTGKYDFKEEAAKGEYLSEKVQNEFDSQDKVIRNVVPIVKDGETVAVLYGVVSLTELAQKYKTEIYDGKAYVYLEDGNTGDFLLDTWHKTLGNVNDFENRKTAPGYDFKQTNKELQDGESGNICFVSSSTGKTIYMHYEPTGINNWNVLVSVDEAAAFYKTESISSVLYIMAVIIGAVLFVYMLFVIHYLLRAYKLMQKLGTEDQVTELQNRNAFETYVEYSKAKEFPIVTCVYLDANGLHEVNNKFGHDVGDQMLRIIANTLKTQFPYPLLYRIGGDEFVMIGENLCYDICEEKMKTVVSQIEKHGYTVSFGMVSHVNEVSLNRIISEADEQMLEMKREYYKTHSRRS